MSKSHSLQILTTDLETALESLTKLMKGFAFYPAGHPMLFSAAAEAHRHFQALLKQHGIHTYRITEAAFWLEDVRLTSNLRPIRKLALRLQKLGIGELTFLPGLTNKELLFFAEELSTQPDQPADDFWVRLARREIGAIMATQLDPTTTDSSTRPRSRVEQFQDLLENLKEPLNNRAYRMLLLQLEPLCPAFFASNGIAGLLAVFNLLECHCKDSTRPAYQQRLAEKMIGRLLTDQVKSTLADAIGDSKLKASQHRALTRLAINLQSKIAPQLLERLYAERDALIRRHYVDILAHMGESIFDLLKTDLRSEIWHVVRNVVTILGKTGLESAVQLLSQVIDHPEPRVRRAIIRALGAIGGTTVIYPLFHLAQAPDSNLQQPAIRALGALKMPQAVPPLEELLKNAGAFGKQTELKLEIVHALAATEAPQAILPLLKLARQQNLLNRKGTELLRAEAIIALGRLGNSKLIPVLKRLPRQRKEPVSSALHLVTTQLRKPSQAA